MKELFDSIENELNSSFETIKNKIYTGGAAERTSQKLKALNIELERLNIVVTKLQNKYATENKINDSQIEEIKKFSEKSLNSFFNRLGFVQK